MTVNVGSADRIARLLAGLLLIVAPFETGLALFESSALTSASVVVGAVLAGTALVRFCPLYAILGIKTCRV